MRDDIEYGTKIFGSQQAIIEYFNDADNDDKYIVSVCKASSEIFIVFYKIEK